MPSENTTEAIDHLTEAVTGIGTGLDGLTAAILLIVGVLQITRLFELSLMLAIIIIAFREKDIILFVLSGAITIFISLSWIDDYPGVTITLGFFAFYQIIWKALIPAMQSGGPARGWSQFKGIVRRIRGNE